MHAETGLLFPYFPQDFQQLEEFCRNQKSNASMNSLLEGLEASVISEYDLGGDWDLFNVPIIEDPVFGLDHMTAASMMSVGEDFISSQGLKAADIETLQSEQLLDDAFYDKDILERDPAETPLSEVLDINIPDQVQEDKPLHDIQFQKNGSSGRLSSTEWKQEAPTNPNFMELPGMDFAAAYGIRRAFSEGDIKTLGSGNISLVHPPLERPIIITNCTDEARKEKLSRYRNKKSKRKFGRKIKYACRKALAENQPRIRGRFAKTEESTYANRCVQSRNEVAARFQRCNMEEISSGIKPGMV